MSSVTVECPLHESRLHINTQSPLCTSPPLSPQRDKATEIPSSDHRKVTVRKPGTPLNYGLSTSTKWRLFPFSKTRAVICSSDMTPGRYVKLSLDADDIGPSTDMFVKAACQKSYQRPISHLSGYPSLQLRTQKEILSKVSNTDLLFPHEARDLDANGELNSSIYESVYCSKSQVPEFANTNYGLDLNRSIIYPLINQEDGDQSERFISACKQISHESLHSQDRNRSQLKLRRNGTFFSGTSFIPTKNSHISPTDSASALINCSSIGIGSSVLTHSNTYSSCIHARSSDLKSRSHCVMGLDILPHSNTAPVSPINWEPEYTWKLQTPCISDSISSELKNDDSCEFLSHATDDSDTDDLHRSLSTDMAFIDIKHYFLISHLNFIRPIEKELNFSLTRLIEVYATGWIAVTHISTSELTSLHYIKHEPLTLRHESQQPFAAVYTSCLPPLSASNESSICDLKV
ncbi:unnamed protein product [Protopolystoma xenopodis]|uniref:Uncharacterized protein n=1 Tax=Protopolystoma xenopodis TaxID=117903 RepID=A0A3S5CM92_9PLAT|nr:unnamed protein product [Protopolystoma xenopodis]